MADFNFKLKLIKTNKGKVVTDKAKEDKFKFKKPRVSVIEKNCDGIVILNGGKHKVMYNNDMYNITDNSISCKSKKVIYLKQANNKYTKIIRTTDAAGSMPAMYKPFKHGLKCKGNIIFDGTAKLFKVVSVYNPASQDELEEAIKEYNNYNINNEYDVNE